MPVISSGPLPQHSTPPDLQHLACAGDIPARQRFWRRHEPTMHDDCAHKLRSRPPDPPHAQVITCAASDSQDVILKKSLYLYITTWAAANPELMLLTINMLLKDCGDQDPTIRGLALRSLCSLRISNLTEYLVRPGSRACPDCEPLPACCTCSRLAACRRCHVVLVVSRRACGMPHVSVSSRWQTACSVSDPSSAHTCTVAGAAKWRRHWQSSSLRACADVTDPAGAEGSPPLRAAHRCDGRPEGVQL